MLLSKHIHTRQNVNMSIFSPKSLVSPTKYFKSMICRLKWIIEKLELRKYYACTGCPGKNATDNHNRNSPKLSLQWWLLLWFRDIEMSRMSPACALINSEQVYRCFTLTAVTKSLFLQTGISFDMFVSRDSLPNFFSAVRNFQFPVAFFVGHTA